MISVHSDRIKNWPDKPGVYLMMNKSGQVIYIGKAKNLKNRVHSYFTRAYGLKTQFLVNKVHSLDYILTHTEAEALLLEASLVKKHKPRYNVRLKDDKAYPYIRLTIKDPFPRLYLDRKVKQDGCKYFGPYSGGGRMVRNIIRFLNENYKIRDCKDSFMKSRKTPCLTYQIGHCTAPCVKEVDYGKQVQLAISFLKGKGLDEIKKLKKQMKDMADQENFEQASMIKNRILSIEEAWEKQLVIDSKTKRDFDIFSYSGEKENLAFEILHVRSGCLIGHSSNFENQAVWLNNKKEMEENCLGFLIQFYMENLIPDEILLHHELTKTGIKRLKTALNRIGEKDVDIHLPSRKNEKSWAQMAYRNSQDKLKLGLKKDQDAKEGLLEIQKIFCLDQFPERIECYDISHFQSSFVYASQVVFENGEKKKSDYRIYKLKPKNDDYESMKEVLSRRFSKKEQEMPQLILVDGGKGQLHTAIQILKDMGIKKVSVASIAKIRGDRLKPFLKSNSDSVRPRFKEKFYIMGRSNPIYVNENRKSFQILVQLRNEAHRFAIAHHRRKLRTTTLVSGLDGIKGIGEKRKSLLLEKFKSLEGIKQANAEKISQTTGINKNLAEKIIQFLKEHEK